MNANATPVVRPQKTPPNCITPVNLSMNGSLRREAESSKNHHFVAEKTDRSLQPNETTSQSMVRGKNTQSKCRTNTSIQSEPLDLFQGIVGTSLVLRQTLEQVKTVAPTDATVLIEGETGTGKELIARAVHNLSPRRDRPYVKFNCAAIPLGLLESELFGHEKGAFTGAAARKIGRFEMANQGTLFLDEIGDIPLELQPKLLRVLQEQEFERLGSNQTQQVNVRIVAATHRNLREMVDQKLFRSDLYFRINIFPINVPPLRERKEDIPLLVRSFIRDCIRRMNRHVEMVPDETMKALKNYVWPGNVRELKNFIERAMIMSPGKLLHAPLDSLILWQAITLAKPRTLAQAESEHIRNAVIEADWVIGGPNGAASKLGLKRTTLIGKMRRLGLARSREPIADATEVIAI